MLVKKTDFSSLDEVLAGTIDSDVVLLSGAPGTGKSDFAVSTERLLDGSQALRVTGAVAKRVRRRG